MMKAFRAAASGAYVLVFSLSVLAGTYAGGDGSAEIPFEISTVGDWEELIGTSGDWDKHFVLTNDIDFEGLPLTPVAPDIDPEEANHQGVRFTGTFDGQGFALRNAVFNLPDEDFVGFFGALGEGGHILNLGVQSVTAAGRMRVGGLCGHNYGGTIRQCYTTGSVAATLAGNNWAGGLVGATGHNGIVEDCYSSASVSGDGRVGGLAGQLSAGEIRRCYATGNVTAIGENVGGLAGVIYDPTSSGTVRDSYATGTVSGGVNVGGLIGNNYRGKVINCYSIGRPTGMSPVGGLCGTATTGTGYQSIANFWDTQTSLTKESAMGTGRTTAQMKTLATFVAAGWDFSNVWWMVEDYTYPMLWPEASEYSGGSGTAEDPYQIGDAASWQKLMWTPPDWDKHFVLTADIDFGGMELVSIAGNPGPWYDYVGTPFNGILDGQGYAVRNIVIHQPEMNYVGLFGYLGASAQIVNLNVSNISVIGKSNVGGLAGQTHGTVANCHITGSVAAAAGPLEQRYYFGGLAGGNCGTISDCSAACVVSGIYATGGLAGTNRFLIDRSYATGTVSGYQTVGGLCGINGIYRSTFSSIIQNSFASGDVTGTAYIGGFVGSHYDGQIIHCYSTGRPTYFGGGGVTQLGGGFCGTISGFYEDTGNFWDIETSGYEYSAMGTGKTTAQMKTLSTFTDAGWDFANIWHLPEDDYPRLTNWVQDYSGGVGSEDNPFCISSVEDWLKLVGMTTHWGRHFVLVNDIDFEGASLVPIAPDINPFEEGFQGTAFIGTFDGQGFSVRNAVIDLPDEDSIGLFGQIGEGGQIRNFGVENIVVTGRSFVGGLAGRNAGGAIFGCHTSGSVAATLAGNSWAGGLVGAVSQSGTVIDSHSLASVSGGSRVGGLAGQLSAGEIRRCYAGGDVTASGDNAGGLAGLIYHSSSSGLIRNSYAVGHVNGVGNVGGLVGYNFRGLVFRCYSTGRPTGTSNIGGLCGIVETGTGFGDVANFWDTQTSQRITSAMGTGCTTLQMKTQSTFTIAGWNFDETWWMVDHLSYPKLWPEAAAYVGGEGTQEDPYQIGSTASWRKLMSSPTDWGKRFIVTADIDLSGLDLMPVAYNPVSGHSTDGFQGTPFSGVIDGQGHTIRNAVIDMPSSDFVGLFGYVAQNGRILNLTVENITVSGGSYVGGIAGWSNGLLDSCHILGDVLPAASSEIFDFYGVIAGVNQGTISNCSADGTVSGGDFVGGLTGYNSNKIVSCYAAARVNGTAFIGGLCGLNQYNPSVFYGVVGTIADSYATGDVFGESYIGGFLGYNYRGKVRHCYSTGYPTGTDAVGGFCGQSLTGTGYEDTGNYWDLQTSQTIVSAMGVGQMTLSMQTLSTFLNAGWDFIDLWELPEGDYPRLLNPQSGYSGGFGSGENPFQISTVDDWLTLIASPEDWDNHFQLVNDIDFEDLLITPVSPDINPFEVNFQGMPFVGRFDGQGFSVKNAVIDLPDQDFVGLFGALGQGGEILNLGVENITAVGRMRVGGLCGQNIGGLIGKCYTTGSVAATLPGNNWAGGLVGTTSHNGIVEDCFSAASVSGDDRVGGLAGQLSAGEIRRCYATGNVTILGNYAGGLVGFIYDPVASGTVRNCYAVGNVTGNAYVGGLVGYNNRGKVIRSYSIGKPTGLSFVGGLCGVVNTGTGYEDTGCFWDEQASQTTASAMGTAETTDQMKTLATFIPTAWNFDTVWALCEGTNYPRLQWQIAAADRVCPDGVGMEDLAHLASRWLLEDCASLSDCDGADLDLSGRVDLGDLALFAAQWLWD